MSPIFHTLAAGLILAAFPARAELLRLHGSPVVAAPMTAAAAPLKALGIEFKITTEGGSGQAVMAVGAEMADIAMVTRGANAEERAAFPGKVFSEVPIGIQALAIIVPRDVWEAGVRSITKAQMTGIYEGQITNWKELGGEDRALKFYNGERGRGVWEFFAFWLYGDIRKAPLGKKFETVVDGEDARNTVEFNAGSMSLAAPIWADGKGVFALGIKGDDGTVAEPTPANLLAKKYPLARPAMLVVAQKPLVGLKKRVIDFMLSEPGQAIVKKAGLIPMSELTAPTP